MHPVRRQRLILVVFTVVAASVAIGLLAFALRQNINLFYAPSQVAAGEAPEGVRIRVGGMVVADSVQRASDSLDVNFLLTDGPHQVRVFYSGILPDLFSEGEAAVAAGVLGPGGNLQASEVLAKHDEKYTPPEVAEAMQRAHEASR